MEIFLGFLQNIYWSNTVSSLYYTQLNENRDSLTMNYHVECRALDCMYVIDVTRHFSGYKGQYEWKRERKRERERERSKSGLDEEKHRLDNINATTHFFHFPSLVERIFYQCNSEAFLIKTEPNTIYVIWSIFAYLMMLTYFLSSIKYMYIHGNEI